MSAVGSRAVPPADPRRGTKIAPRTTAGDDPGRDEGDLDQ